MKKYDNHLVNVRPFAGNPITVTGRECNEIKRFTSKVSDMMDVALWPDKLEIIGNGRYRNFKYPANPSVKWVCGKITWAAKNLQ